MSQQSYSRLEDADNVQNGVTTTVNGINDRYQEGNTEETKDEEEVPSISYFTLFRFASTMDKLCITIAALCSIAGGCLTPIDTIIFSNLLESMVDYGKHPDGDIFLKAVLTFTILSSVIGVGHILTTYLSTVSMNVAAANLVFKIRREYVRAALSQDFEYYDTHQTGDVASKLNDNMRKIEDGIGEKAAMTIYYLSSFVSMVIMALIKGWKLALICLTTLPIPFILYFSGNVATSRIAKKQNAALGKSGAIADEVLNSIRTVYAFNGQQKELERYEHQLKKMRYLNIKMWTIKGFAFGAVSFVVFTTYALSYWVGYKLMNEEPENYDVATTIAVFYGVMIASNNLSNTSWLIEVFGEASRAGAKIFNLIDYKSKINPLKDEPDSHTPDYVEGNIEFRDVVFHYPSRPDVPVLKGVSFKVKRGQSVAIVGHSGCGKSSIIQLISRYYDVIDGNVIIDEYDVRDLQIRWLRAQIGLVGQEPVLFNTTVRENIRYSWEGASDNDIESAAKQVNAHNFIMKLPKGYNTLVGERGTSLSGGQKQRIAIARALVRNPTILLLDEATSALDSHSEAKVQAGLEKAREGRTTIVVAHRLSTIRNVDVIYVMKNGEFVEVGNHKELMEMKGYYHEMVTHIAPLGNEDEDTTTNTSNRDTYEDTDDEETAELISRRNPIRMDTMNEEDTKPSEVPFWKVVRLNGPEWKSITIASLTSLIDGFTWPILGIVLGNFIGALSNPNKEEVLSLVKLYCITFLVTGAVSWILEIISRFFYAIAGEYLTERLRKRMFENYLLQEVAYFDDKNNSVGAIGARLSGDAAAVQGATGRRIGTVVNALGALIFAIATSLYYEWRIGLVSLTLLPLTAAVVYQEGQMIMQNSFVTVKAMERSSKIAVETVSNIRTVASLGREEQFIMEYCAELMPALAIAKRSAHWRGMIYGFSNGLDSLIYAVTMYYGGNLIVYHQVAYSLILTSSQAVMMGANCLGSAFAWAPNFREGLSAAGRIIASLKKQSAIVDPDTPAVNNFTGTGEVSLQYVHFSYPTRPSIKVMNNLNLKVERGKTVALVGSSGCGKSTVVQLIQRYYDPNEGVVTQDNIPLPELRLADIRKIIGFVQQEPVLFDRTIGENIAYGDNSREPSKDEIIEAAKLANIHQFIAALPNGYDTNIGSRGAQLSGGQKQRVAIARALIRKPKLLLLDEATSALDNESEKIVQEALDRAKEGRACVVIAHRLSTIRDADNICVVRDGRVTESGTHAQLMELKGIYYELSLKGQM